MTTEQKINNIRAVLQAAEDDSAWNAFNDLLAELDAARAREQQLEAALHSLRCAALAEGEDK